MRTKVIRVAAAVPAIRRFYAWQYAPWFHACLLDGWNRIFYGPTAPRFAERLWIDPLRVQGFDRKGTIWKSARVHVGDWSTRNQQPIEDDPILQASIARWVDGLPWEATGEVERVERAIRRHGQHDGCRTRAEILQRCARLDDIFRVIEREGRVRTQAEVEPGTFREFGGIGLHIGPGGRLIRAGNGRHRFAMAKILQIRRIPVRIGLVHHSALPLLEDLRRNDQGVVETSRQ